jgi:hypothetical protein
LRKYFKYSYKANLSENEKKIKIANNEALSTLKFNTTNLAGWEQGLSSYCWPAGALKLRLYLAEGFWGWSYDLAYGGFQEE